MIWILKGRFQRLQCRTINLQIDTKEPGRIIGYHGKVFEGLATIGSKLSL